MVVILNDNGMSIASNVGGVAKHLSLVRLKPGYFGLKKAYRQFTRNVPGGRFLYECSHRVKTWLRRKLIGVTLFEEMGFQYLGPVDGHDVQKLTFLLKEAKEMHMPVLLHVITRKGKGYIPAEAMPSSFHGVGKFNPATGIRSKAGATTFSETFGQTLRQLAAEHPEICAITAAMESGTGLGMFASAFPKRYFDVGIAEGHAVCMAAGLAKQEMVPVFAVYSTFLQRSYDMLIHDISLLQLHVVLAIDRAGLVGEDGETHHGVFDVGFLRQVPGMTVFCPASQAELRRMLPHAVLELNGPVAIRYPKGGDGRYQETCWEDMLHADSKLTMLSYGTTINDVLAAAEHLQNEGISADVLKLDVIQPMDLTGVVRSAKKTGRLLIVEEAAAAGCVGDAVLSGLMQQGITVQAHLLNLRDGIVPHGDLKSLRSLLGIDEQGIYLTAKELLRHET